MTETHIIMLAICTICIVTLAFVWVMYRRISRIKVNNPRVEQISNYIRDGAIAFMKREYRIIVPFTFIVGIVLALLGLIPGLEHAEGVGWQSAICFAVGSFTSGLVGIIGMLTATKANARTAMKASESGLNGSLRMALSGGAIFGLSVACLSLLSISGLFLIFYSCTNLELAIHVVCGYGLGCSMIALFSRIGGGIYTKAADIGADLAGKLAVNIPEDDLRNPGVIAYSVGENVSEVAGASSDLCESYIGAIISALTLGVVATINSHTQNAMFVFMIVGLGALCSAISVLYIRVKKWDDPRGAIKAATYLATFLVVVGTLIISLVYLDNPLGAFFAVLAGILVGLIIGLIAEYYTSSEYKKVKEIAKQSQTGHATNIIAGFGSGMQSTALTILVIAGGIALSFLSYSDWGIALAAVGMLSTVGITVSISGYGPIAENAGELVHMAGLSAEVQKITIKLDAVGNTTAAIDKGFCIASSTFTTLALFVAYTNAVGKIAIDATKPQVIIGLLLGAMLPYLFSALTIKSVGKAAKKMVEEIREQFDNDPGILSGTSMPNYVHCIDISTRSALKEMILPAVLAIASPIIVAFALGALGLGGLLVGSLASGIMLAVLMAYAGTAWDNAKKYIEKGHYGGIGSETHKASITGDAVGDPFKDTACPAISILIKLMTLISLILAPIISAVDFKSLWDIIAKFLT